MLYRKLVGWRAAREPVYADYKAAAAARKADYHDPDLAAVVLEKTRRIRAIDPWMGVGEHQAVATLLAVTTAVTATKAVGRPLRVLDFGGAFGTAYHMVRHALPGDYQWAVVETPTFARLGVTEDHPGLRLFDSIDDAVAWLGDVDLLYSSGAIQYLPDPLGTLDRLLEVRPACTAWLRTAFSTESEVVVLQSSRLADNGPGPLPAQFKDAEVHYPRTYLPLAAFLQRFQPRYRLIIEYGDGTPTLTVGGQNLVVGQNYLFVRQGS
ncbi:methyltransferase, TIGR04325 family [Brevundimonas sp.]|uniref:methyltransferase, TIGR04325 family n=1 Tax=Brevundimonas sp. TaxID=1871086 RepID=UPI00391B718E